MPIWLMPVIWGALIAVLLIVEYVSHELVTIWFAGGFLVGFVLSLISPIYEWWYLQLGVSIVVSAVLLIATRPIVKRWMQVKQTPVNIDKRIGHQAYLVSPITKHEYGTIQIADVLWRVTSNKPIESGKLVRIIDITGSKFVVEEVADGVLEETVFEEQSILVEK